MTSSFKYCGGCNPVYNRGRQVKRLQEQYPEHEFDFAAGDMKECEIGLVVCGCVRACASVDGLTPKKKLFLLPTERSFSEVKTYLEQDREAKKNVEVCGRKDAMPGEMTDSRIHVRIGDTAEVTKTFFKDDVDRFRRSPEITADFTRMRNSRKKRLTESRWFTVFWRQA